MVVINDIIIQYADIRTIYGNIPLHSSGHVHTRSGDNVRDVGDHVHNRVDNHDIRNVLLHILRIPRNLALLLSCDDDDDDDDGDEVVECDDDAEAVDGEAHSDHDDDAGCCNLPDPEPFPERQESLDLWHRQAQPLPSWL